MKSKGFTLIELLVVVAIIGVLATMIINSFSSVRLKTKETKRIAILDQLEKALELYYLDNGSYPQIIYAHNINNPTGMDIFENIIRDYLDIDFSEDSAFGIYEAPYWVQYRYASTSANNYQSYGFGITFNDPSNNHLEQNDGGAWISIYEFGDRPRYCQDKYGIGHWWVGATVCSEGN